VDFIRPIEAIVPGAQGRVLAVLVETTAELNLRTIARLAGVSQAQTSRVLPELVDSSRTTSPHGRCSPSPVPPTPFVRRWLDWLRHSLEHLSA
jgi:hypothetical protein